MEMDRQLSLAALHEKGERRKKKHIKDAVTGGLNQKCSSHRYCKVLCTTHHLVSKYFLTVFNFFVFVKYYLYPFM